MIRGFQLMQKMLNLDEMLKNYNQIELIYKNSANNFSFVYVCVQRNKQKKKRKKQTKKQTKKKRKKKKHKNVFIFSAKNIGYPCTRYYLLLLLLCVLIITKKYLQT